MTTEYGYKMQVFYDPDLLELQTKVNRLFSSEDFRYCQVVMGELKHVNNVWYQTIVYFHHPLNVSKASINFGPIDHQ